MHYYKTKSLFEARQGRIYGRNISLPKILKRYENDYDGCLSKLYVIDDESILLIRLLMRKDWQY